MWAKIALTKKKKKKSKFKIQNFLVEITVFTNKNLRHITSNFL